MNSGASILSAYNRPSLPIPPNAKVNHVRFQHVPDRQFSTAVIALESVLAPGRRVRVQHPTRPTIWRYGHVVKPWANVHETVTFIALDRPPRPV